MEKASFWDRVGRWFRGAPEAADVYDERGTTGRYDSVQDTDSDRDDGPGIKRLTAGGNTPGSASRLHQFRLGPRIDRLEEEYSRVVSLMDTIHQQLASYGERSEKIAGSVDRIARSLADAPDSLRQMLNLLGSISKDVAVDVARAKQVDENLAQLPRIADAQREAIVSIGRRLELSQQSGERLATTMDALQQAITTLAKTTDDSCNALREMRSEMSAREERVAELLQEQGKRFMVFGWSAVGLACVAIVVALIALLT